jgi:hypothetical protein
LPQPSSPASSQQSPSILISLAVVKYEKNQQKLSSHKERLGVLGVFQEREDVLDMMAYVCNSSCSGGGNRRVTIQDQPRKTLVKLYLKKKKRWAW